MLKCEVIHLKFNDKGRMIDVFFKIYGDRMSISRDADL